MECREAVYAEDVLSYIISNHRGDEYISNYYNPDCYIIYDSIQAVVYKQVPKVSSEVIGQHGFSAIPNVYGLMSEQDLEASGVLRIRRQPYLDLYGQGILLGFVDTGIDYTHEAFINADNTSRIVTIWDQTDQQGMGTGRFPYGEIYNREIINQALENDNPLDIVPVQDQEGHGTFLAGVAAGNENRSQQFSGVAPLSDIVVVKCKQAKQSYRDYYGIPSDVPAYQEDDIMAGIAYLLDVANRERKPLIVCVGLGTNMGNHVGFTSLSSYMNRYAAYWGVGMFACIGNEGNARHHHWIQKKEDSININVERSMKGFMAQLWWQMPESLTLDLISPSGEEVTGVRAVSGVRMNTHFTKEDTDVEIYFGTSQELTIQQVVVMRFIAPKTGIWTIRTHFEQETPSFHMWLPIRQFLEEEVVFLSPSPEFTICNPATASNLITISAYDSSNDSLYLQSGRGFLIQNEIKPSVVAPGVNITGPYPKGRYGTMSGTGAATALAAGIGALIMERYDATGITGIRLQEIFIRGAEPRGVPVPNIEWGYGIVNAYDSITE